MLVINSLTRDDKLSVFSGKVSGFLGVSCANPVSHWLSDDVGREQAYHSRGSAVKFFSNNSRISSLPFGLSD
jgi:hypothetical protein